MIGARPEAGLSAEDVGVAVMALRAAGATTGAPDWLAPRACDVPFAGIPPRGAAAQAAAYFQGAPLDFIAQPAAGRRKRLLLADLDSTIIAVECIDALADLAGVGAAVAAITARAMRGEIDFITALSDRVALLAGLPVTALARVLKHRAGLRPGARALVETMRRHGAYAALVSGGFTYFAEAVAAMAGFDEFRANRLELADGRLTGRLEPPLLGPEAKHDYLIELLTRLGLASAETIAVGDGANDRPMLAAAGLGVAYRATPLTIAAAAATVRDADLCALLYVQGYREAEIVS
ncbi:MAG: phosphoserine phosphatase SerB [Alphaproteobacteria bacterium]|nr:phosphoserine phosphatase SerB [Alphaproteobacteria bacterium]